MGTTYRCFCLISIVGLFFVMSGCKQAVLQKPESALESTHAMATGQNRESARTDERRVSDGDTVLVQYVARLADGTIISRTEDEKVLQLIIGERSAIPGLDQAIKGMQTHETKNFRLDTRSAYGEYNPQLMRTFERSDLPADIEPVRGMVLKLTDADGRQIAGTVTTVEETRIDVDLNHPLAGKDLFLAVRIVAIQ